AIADGGADCAKADRESKANQGAGENESVVSHTTLLVVFVLEAFARTAEVDHREQHEDERLDEPDEDDVERLPDREQDGADYGPAHNTHQRQGEGTEAC